MLKYNSEISLGENTSHGQMFRMVNNGDTVLEIGCAAGLLSKEMKEQLSCSITGIDIDAGSIDLAKKYLDRAITCNIECYPFEKELSKTRFDKIIFADVLEHLHDPISVLKRAVTLLKDDGKVLFSIPNIAHADVIAGLIYSHFDYSDTGLLDESHVHFFAISSLIPTFEKSGLTVQRLGGVTLPLGSTEQKREVSGSVKELITASGSHNVYQFVGCAVKTEYAEKEGIEPIIEIDDLSEKTAFVYTDRGQGFSENDKQSISIKNGVCSTRVNLGDGAKRMRLDVSESGINEVYGLSVKAEDSECPLVSSVNVVSVGDGYTVFGDSCFIFDTNGSDFVEICFRFADPRDPAFCEQTGVGALNTLYKSEKELLRDKKALGQVCDSLRESNDALSDTVKALSERERTLEERASSLESLLNTEKERCDDLSVNYARAMEEINAQRSVIENLQAMYSCISGSFFWKITKPFRFTLDLIKKIPGVRTVIKGLKCVKQNGIKYTFAKVKGKLRHNRQQKSAAPTKSELLDQGNEVFPVEYKFSILVPLYNTPTDLLSEMIESVLNQSYKNLELCLADGSAADNTEVERVCKEYAEKDGRVKYKRLEKNLGISGNTNACLEMASGDYIGLFDHDDLLMPSALYENMKAITETGADVLYSDEDHLSPSGKHVNPFYKPDYSPDLLRSQMYICHFLVIRSDLLRGIGGFNSEFDGSQDYDLMLRLSEATDKIVHIPRILYTWRECEGSTASDAGAKPYAHTAGKRALDAHLKRVFGDEARADESEYTFVFDARFPLKDEPLVSIIIPMKDKCELTDACVKSIIEKSTYKNYEVIILDNRSVKKETYEWFSQIERLDSRISVHKADMEFNWSKINNYGITKAKGDVYIFLNNDIEVITPDWIERLAENAVREDIGVVGPLLLFEDGTIQHAGVVVGIGGWADHIFRGGQPVHYGAPYVSPMVARNVLAVTGACLAVSKRTIEKIGEFDESFIICGSDIELGIRAYQSGLYNKYLPTVKLYHYESKSRNASDIPEVDFKRSYECYAPYRENVDPFYNINLDTNYTCPVERVAPMSMVNFKNFLKRCPFTAPIVRAVKRAVMPPAEYSIPEIGELGHRVDSKDNGKLRLNLLTPSVDEKHVFGGISTAIKLFESLAAELNCERRMITVDAPVIESSAVVSKDYRIVDCSADSDAPVQLVSFSDRYGKTVPVRKNDIFVATGWWTAYTVKEIIKWQAETFGNEPMPLVYMIQDYEPGFYPWSSRYMMADSTYRLKTPTLAVINSELLREFFDKGGYTFTGTWSFQPVLNDKLRVKLPKGSPEVEKKKQILVYGRPTTERNAFALLVAGLKLWRERFDSADQWQVLSAGETHNDVDLGGGVMLHSLGKLTIDGYADTMLDTYAGVSLMVSPHPSYPPLEMSTFGVKTITNSYSNKNIESFNGNIVSLDSCSADDIADALIKITEGFDGKGRVESETEYAKGGAPFGDCVPKLADAVKGFINE